MENVKNVFYIYGTYCHCQQTPSHQCSREFLSLATCFKYKVIPSVEAKTKDLVHQDQGLKSLAASTVIRSKS